MTHSSKTAIIVGIGSDIGFEIAKRLIRDDWRIVGTYRKTRPDVGVLQLQASFPGSACIQMIQADVRECPVSLLQPWDELIFCVGTMEPIGEFFDVDEGEWEAAVEVNALAPLRLLRRLYPHAREGASVVFFDGPNMDKPTPTYTAYKAGKAILHALLPTLRAEYPYVNFSLLHTGVVQTKIHLQTIVAGNRAANYERALRIEQGFEKTTSFDDVYRMIA